MPPKKTVKKSTSPAKKASKQATSTASSSSSPRKKAKAKAKSAASSSGSKKAASSAKKVEKTTSELEKPDYYLFKSEPLSRFEKKTHVVNGKTYNVNEDCKFSFDDLAVHVKDGKKGVAEWDGVRAYLARNIMRTMKKGDKAFFYHSNAKDETGIVGIVEIVKEAYPDDTQNDPSRAHYEKQDGKRGSWDCVDVKYIRKLKRLISLKELQTDPFLSKSMMLFKSGPRPPSVCGVKKAEWDYILNKLEAK